MFYCCGGNRQLSCDAPSYEKALDLNKDKKGIFRKEGELGYQADYIIFTREGDADISPFHLKHSLKGPCPPSFINKSHL